jgi:hypothetical protein
MATASPQPDQEETSKRAVVSIDPDFHQRIKVLAAVAGVQIKDVIFTILDFMLPKLESGELKIQKPTSVTIEEVEP